MPEIVKCAHDGLVVVESDHLGVKPKAPRPRKLKKSVCFATAVSVFDKGQKKLDVTLCPTGIWLHAARRSERYFLPFGVAYDKAVAIAAGFDAGPRRGRVTRNANGGQQ